MASKDPLLQPFQLKHLTLKNRIMSTAHEPLYSEDGMPKERYRLYHEEKAKGGLALTVIGGSTLVADDSPPAFGNLEGYRDEIIPWFRELADGVHAHDCAVMCQITHLGRRSAWNQGHWFPLVAASPIREHSHRAYPKEAETYDLERIVKAYGATARRCREGGLDGIEIEAQGHFLDGFWSPATNRRHDNYGGSLDNRLRLTFEVLEEIRRQVGDDYIVGVRMILDEAMAGGLEEDEGFEIARRFSDSGLVDFLNVLRGHVDSDEGMSHVIPTMGTPAAPHLELAGRVREAFELPVFHAARINDAATARYAVAEGLLDMVGMTRAHMADPYITAKIERGEESQIRPCVGAGYCIDGIYEHGQALCLHNPATGREKLMPHVLRRDADPVKKVVIVGAGPGGLEAARVCGERGHQAVVFEAADQPGGQVRLAAALQRRREIMGIIDWRQSECERLEVPVHTNRFVEAEEVLAEKPDVVILATGGLPNTSFLEQGEDLVVTAWDILSGDAKPGQRVLLYDDNGNHPGLTTAEVLAAGGAQVEIVTPERTLAVDVGGTNYPAYFKAFAELGVEVNLNLRLRGVRRDGNQLAAQFYSDFSRQTTNKAYDQVVVEHGTLPLDELYWALKPGSRNLGELDLEAFAAVRPQAVERNPEGRYQLFRIGDAVAGRNIHAAIYDALRLCVAL